MLTLRWIACEQPVVDVGSTPADQGADGTVVEEDVAEAAGGGRVSERLNQIEKSAVSTIHMQLQVVMPGNNLLGPEMSVLIPQYRGVHILQVSNVHKSQEETWDHNPMSRLNRCPDIQVF